MDLIALVVIGTSFVALLALVAGCDALYRGR